MNQVSLFVLLSTLLIGAHLSVAETKPQNVESLQEAAEKMDFLAGELAQELEKGKHTIRVMRAIGKLLPRTTSPERNRENRIEAVRLLGTLPVTTRAHFKPLLQLFSSLDETRVAAVELLIELEDPKPPKKAEAVEQDAALEKKEMAANTLIKNRDTTKRVARIKAACDHILTEKQTKATIAIASDKQSVDYWTQLYALNAKLADPPKSVSIEEMLSYEDLLYENVVIERSDSHGTRTEKKDGANLGAAALIAEADFLGSVRSEDFNTIAVIGHETIKDIHSYRRLIEPKYDPLFGKNEGGWTELTELGQRVFHSLFFKGHPIIKHRQQRDGVTYRITKVRRSNLGFLDKSIRRALDELEKSKARFLADQNRRTEVLKLLNLTESPTQAEISEEIESLQDNVKHNSNVLAKLGELCLAPEIVIQPDSPRDFIQQVERRLKAVHNQLQIIAPRTH